MPLPAVTGAQTPPEVQELCDKIHSVIICGQSTAINKNNIIEVPVASVNAVTEHRRPRLIDVTYEFKARVVSSVTAITSSVMPFYGTKITGLIIRGVSENLKSEVDAFVDGLQDNKTPWADLLSAADRITQNMRVLGQLPGLNPKVRRLHASPDTNVSHSNCQR